MNEWMKVITCQFPPSRYFYLNVLLGRKFNPSICRSFNTYSEFYWICLWGGQGDREVWTVQIQLCLSFTKSPLSVNPLGLMFPVYFCPEQPVLSSGLQQSYSLWWEPSRVTYPEVTKLLFLPSMIYLFITVNNILMINFTNSGNRQ